MVNGLYLAPTIDETQKTNSGAECEGASASFIPSDDHLLSSTDEIAGAGSDSASVSNSSGSKGSTGGVSNSSRPKKEEGSNYLENKEDKASETSETRGASSGRGGSDDLPDFASMTAGDIVDAYESGNLTEEQISRGLENGSLEKTKWYAACMLIDMHKRQAAGEDISQFYLDQGALFDDMEHVDVFGNPMDCETPLDWAEAADEISDYIYTYLNNPETLYRIEEVSYDGDHGQPAAFLNGETFDRLFHLVNLYFNILLMIAMSNETKQDIHDAIFNSLAINDYSQDRKFSLVECIAKAKQSFIKNIKIALLKTQEFIDTYNGEVKEKLLAAGSANLFADWLTSGLASKWAKIEADEDAANYLKKVEAKNQEELAKIGGFAAGLDEAGADQGNELYENMMHSKDYVHKTKNGYMDTPLARDAILEYQSYFIGLNNETRMILNTKAVKDSIRKMIFQSISGVKATPSRLETLEQEAESQIGFATAMFEMGSQAVMESLEAYNQWHYADLQNNTAVMILDIFAQIFNGVGKLLGFIPNPITRLAGLGAQLIGGGFGLISGAVNHAIDDEFDVTGISGFESAGGFSPEMIDMLGLTHTAIAEPADNPMERIENEIKRDLGPDLFIKDNEGYVQLDWAAIADLTEQFGGVQNLARIIFKNLDLKDELRRLIGNSLRETEMASSSDNSAALEACLELSSAQFNALVQNLEDYQFAWNSERQDDIAWKEAYINFGAGTAGAGAGYFIPGVGADIGKKIAEAITEMALSNNSAGTSAPGMEEFYTISEEAFNLREETGNNIVNSFQSRENAIYEELLEARAEAGGGRWAIDADKIKELEERLAKLMSVFVLYLSIIELRARIMNAIRASFGYSSAQISSSMGLVQAHVSTSFEIFGQLRKQLDEKIQTHNRIDAAKDRQLWAAINGAITLASSAFSILSNFISSIPKAVTKVAKWVFTVAEIAASIIRPALIKAEGYGKLKKYQIQEQAEAEKEKQTRENREIKKKESIWDSLDRREANIRIDGRAIAETAFGVWQADSGYYSDLVLEIERLHRVREIILEAMETKEEVRVALARSLGAPVTSNSYAHLKFINQITKTAALGALEAQFQAVNAVAQQHNRMTRAEVALIEAAVMGILNVTISVLKDVVSHYRSEVDRMQKRGEASLTRVEKAQRNEYKHISEGLTKAAVALEYTAVVTKFTFALATFAYSHEVRSGKAKKVQAQEVQEKKSQPQKSRKGPDGKGWDELEKSIASLKRATAEYSMRSFNSEIQTDRMAQIGELSFDLLDASIKLGLQINEWHKPHEKPQEAPGFKILPKMEVIAKVPEISVKLDLFFTQDSLKGDVLLFKPDLTEEQIRAQVQDPAQKEVLVQMWKENAKIIPAGSQSAKTAAAPAANVSPSPAATPSPNPSANLMPTAPTPAPAEVVSATPEVMFALEMDARQSADIATDAVFDFSPEGSTAPEKPLTIPSYAKASEGKPSIAKAQESNAGAVETLNPKSEILNPKQILNPKSKVEQVRDEFASKFEQTLENLQSQPKPIVQTREIAKALEISVPSNKPAVTFEDLVKQAQDLKAVPVAPNAIQPAVNQITKMVTEMQRSVSSAIAYSQQLETVSNPTQIAQAEKAVSAKVQNIVQEKTGNKDLTQLKTHEEFQQVYEDLYNEVFAPARENLQQAVKQRQAASHKLKNAQTEEEKQQAQTELQTAQAEEGKIRQQIQAYNRMVGQIDRACFKVTGEHLKSVATPAATADPAASSKPMTKEEQYQQLLENVYRPNQQLFQAAKSLRASVVVKQGQIVAIDENQALKAIDNLLKNPLVEDKVKEQLKEVKQIIEKGDLGKAELEKIMDALKTVYQLQGQAELNVKNFKARAQQILPELSAKIEQNPETVLEKKPEQNASQELDRPSVSAPETAQVQTKAAVNSEAALREYEKEIKKLYDQAPESQKEAIAEKALTFQKNKSEALNLIKGMEKYSENPQVIAQMETILQKKKEEFEKALQELKVISEKKTGIKMETRALYNEMSQWEVRSKVKSQKSKAGSEKSNVKKEMKTVSQPQAKADVAAAQPQFVASGPKTLRDKALAEQAGQEAFYKSFNKGGKSYGAA